MLSPDYVLVDLLHIYNLELQVTIMMHKSL
jgi:hypothetical protein